MKNEYSSSKMKDTIMTLSTMLCHLVNVSLVVSCADLSVDSDPELARSFYYYDHKKIHLMPSQSNFIIRFADATMPEDAAQLLERYSVEIDGDLYSDGFGLRELIEYNIPIILKATGNANISQYFTDYPRPQNSQILGNLPQVQYCLPGYTVENGHGGINLLFLTDRIIFKSEADTTELFEFLDQFKLTNLHKKYLGRHIYAFELTDESPSDALQIANTIYNSELIDWAYPDWVSSRH